MNTLAKIRFPAGHAARRTGRSVVRVAIPTLAIAAIVLPLTAVLLKPTGQWSRVTRALDGIPNFSSVLLNTVLLAAGSVLVAVVLGTLLALSSARLTGRRYQLSVLLGTFPIFMPFLASVFGWIFLFSPRVGYANQLLRATPFFDGMDGPFDIYTLPWIVGLTGQYLASYVFVFVSTALRDLDPAIEAAARVGGGGWFVTQLRIVLPSVRPAVVYASVICFLLALGQLTAPLILGRSEGIEVVTTQIQRLTANAPSDVALAALLALPVTALSLVLAAVQIRSIGRTTRFSSTTKGVSYVRPRRVWPVIPSLLHFFFTFVPPLCGLIIVSMVPFWSKDIQWGAMSLQNYRQVWNSPDLQRAVVDTIQLAVVGTIFTLVIAFAISRYLLRGRGVLRSVLDFVVSLPIAVPAIIFGLGVFLSYGSPRHGLYGSRWLFIIAWTILVLPHAVRILMAGQLQLGRDVESAARVSGSSAPHALLRMVVPLLRRSLASAGMLAFVLMSHEFAAAVLIRTTRTQVLSTKLYEISSFGKYPQVAALAVIMMCVSLVGAGAFLAAGGRRGRSGT